MTFVVGLSEASMGTLLQKLGALLAREYDMIRGVNGDIQEINDELSSMQAFLGLFHGIHRDPSKDVMNWVRQIRDVSYDIEDCVDDCTLRLIGRRQRRGGDGFISSVLVRLQELGTWYPRRSIASSIKELKDRAQRISERRNRYGVEAGPRDYQWDRDNNNVFGGTADGYRAAENQLVRGRQLVGVKDPVGMAGAMRELGRWIADGEKKQGVLALVGFSGVGKTTLAMALYNNFQDPFDRRAMVTVSQKFNLGAVLRSILSQVMLDTSLLAVDQMNEYQLRDLLHEQLRGKRFFFFIDDVWSATAWITIRKYLPPNEKGSKILVTTRFQAVARTCFRAEESDVLHRVDRLSEEDSKELFDASLSQSTGGEFDMQERNSVSDSVWKSCNGLPLAIVIMAGVVASDKDSFATGWRQVPTIPAINTPVDVEMIIRYCYNDLPTDLKSCMLYLGVFPKSFRISRKRLTRRWIAEGILGEKSGLSAEEVAEVHFGELLRRNIIRAADHGTDGKVKTCQVHDMIHEFIVSKSSEEAFINVVGGHWHMPIPTNKVRRLSLHTTDQVDTAIEAMNLSRVRSLTVFGTSHKFPFRSFKLRIVQVLDLEGCKGFKKHHMKQVAQMILLKYLSLRKTDIHRLSSSIGKLMYLETLDIRETKVSVLPKHVVELHRLSKLLCGNKRTRKPVKLPREMSSKPIVTLSILSGVEIVEGAAALTDLHSFTMLRKLMIYKLNLQKDSLGFKDLMSSIEYLGSGSLHSLEIDDESSDFINSLDSMSSPPRHLTALHLHGKLLKVPEWIPDLDDLIKLTLSVTVLRTDTFELLASMPSLFCLTFSFNVEKQDLDTETILDKNKLESGGSISVPGGGYKSLKLLRFASPLLPLLTFSDGAMPEVQRIDLQFTRLEDLTNMDNLASLREVHLTMNKDADGATREKVNGLATTARGGANKFRVIVNAW